MSTIRAPKQWKSVSAVRNCAVSVAGPMGSTAETISGVSLTHSTDLTTAVVAASTATLVIDGVSVIAGQAFTYRVSGGTAGTTYDIRATITTNQSQTIIGNLPLKVISDSA